jgi:hypothetical protein
VGDGALLIRSDNSATGRAERIENGNGIAFEVLGRVVSVWRGKIMKKLLLIALIGICSLLSSSLRAQVVGGKVSADSTIGNWESFYLSFPSAVQARMISRSLSSATAMVLDAYPPECTGNFQWIFPLNQTVNSDTPLRILPIFIRVDSGPMHAMSASFQATMGDSYGIISLNSTPEFRSLIQEMDRGGVARVRIEDEKGTTIETDVFSLIGFNASLARINQGCLALNHVPSPSPSTPSPSRPPAPRSSPPGLQSL